MTTHQNAVAVAAQPFSALRDAVARQFAGMSQHSQLFRVDVPKDVLWDTYLQAFRSEDNPIYRTRTEHDCQCCRHFVRTVGGVVAIIDGAVVTVWEGDAGERYRPVMEAMRALVSGAPILEPFLHTERQVGVAKTFQQLLLANAAEGDPPVITWDHFHLTLPEACVVGKDDLGPRLSEARGTFDAMRRSLDEITPDAVDTVLELVAQNSLYRGEEHAGAVRAFGELKAAYEELPGSPARRDRAAALFCWSRLAGTHPAVAKMRGTVIGTLLCDLSEGKEMDQAVGAYEAKVAPTNYKRPTALVTKAMVEKARAEIEALGYTASLERRYAVIEDVAVGDLLFVDRGARKAPRRAGAAGALDELAEQAAPAARDYSKVEEVAVDAFVTRLLPGAKSLEIFVENGHAGNLVSLVAPVDPTAPVMFKWPNPFSWSYVGDVADSIKDRVKRAGGAVEGVLCCRLAWDYTDDLDFHLQEPGMDSYVAHIYYGNRRSPCGGELDLDANGCDGMRAEPVENIYYADDRRLAPGEYVLSVHNYNKRDAAGKGFEVELEFGGVARRMAYDKALRTGETVEVAALRWSRAGGFEVVRSLPSSTASKVLWGVRTQDWARVNALMFSPNYWGGAGVGNRHWFFMLEGCANDGQARGFYNEFLDERLTPHRKVFEMAGARMRTGESARQLSGLGFSSTRRASVLVRLDGAFRRAVRVVF